MTTGHSYRNESRATSVRDQSVYRRANVDNSTGCDSPDRSAWNMPPVVSTGRGQDRIGHGMAEAVTMSQPVPSLPVRGSDDRQWPYHASGT